MKLQKERSKTILFLVCLIISSMWLIAAVDLDDLRTTSVTPADSVQNVQVQMSNNQEFGISLKTYYGVTPQIPDNFLTCIKFSSNNQVEMWDGEWPDGSSNKKSLKSGTYSISKTNGLDFMTIFWRNGLQETFLFLTNNGLNALYLYKSDSSPYFKRLSDPYFGGFVIFGNDSWINASSSFRETINGRTVLYSPDKLGEKIGECWVPTKGINETLTLSINRSSGDAGKTIYISSGFVSFSKPHLYGENSRIRKIQLYDSFGNSKIVELKDTPHFQTVPIDDIGNSNGSVSTVNLKILEVYPGSKYSDVCLNSIFYIRFGD